MDDASPELRRSLIYQVPPGGRLRLGDRAEAVTPLWAYWLKIAEDQAAASRDARPSDEMIDHLSDKLAGLESAAPEGSGHESADEIRAAMVAIASAAHSLDGFYGAAKLEICPPVSGAKRHRQILECLKLGFRLSHRGHTWAPELEWLFDLRDSLVHFAEKPRPLTVSRTTTRTVVMGGPENYEVSALSAQRAAELAREVLSFCLLHPKAGLREWAAERASAIGEPDSAGGRVVTVGTERVRISPAEPEHERGPEV